MLEGYAALLESACIKVWQKRKSAQAVMALGGLKA